MYNSWMRLGSGARAGPGRQGVGSAARRGGEQGQRKKGWKCNMGEGCFGCLKWEKLGRASHLTLFAAGPRAPVRGSGPSGVKVLPPARMGPLVPHCTAPASRGSEARGRPNNDPMCAAAAAAAGQGTSASPAQLGQNRRMTARAVVHMRRCVLEVPRRSGRRRNHCLDQGLVLVGCLGLASNGRQC